MPPIPRRLVAILAVLALLALSLGRARADSDIGIVLLHGKHGASYDRPIAPLLYALRNAGYPVSSPTMCWARTRIYDAAFPDCLREIDAAITALRGMGAHRFIVAGESLGGNAALAYGAQHPELAGIIALAPAAVPDQLVQIPAIARSLAQARQMVAAGQGNQRAGFADSNLGQTFTVNTTAAIYVSFFDPDGPAEFPKLLASVRPPVIWVAGSRDHFQHNAATLFAELPANPLNRQVVVDADHLGTPAAGTAAVLAWLKTLPAIPGAPAIGVAPGESCHGISLAGPGLASRRRRE